MLDSESVDVVIIYTPGGLHVELACQAMRSSRHVIVEKPIEITRKAIDEILQVQQTAEQNRNFLQVVLTRRAGLDPMADHLIT